MAKYSRVREREFLVKKMKKVQSVLKSYLGNMKRYERMGQVFARVFDQKIESVLIILIWWYIWIMIEYIWYIRYLFVGLFRFV